MWCLLRNLRSSACNKGDLGVLSWQQWKRLCVRSRHDGRWTSQDIRTTFLEFFKQRDHQYVHSSSVVPKKGEGTYFINAGMNQFKPIFLGTVDPESNMAAYRRVVNSQKCIRVGGKHNDLDSVGKDTYHHTFFEMLGSWSFGDYFKEEACSMAWHLMTKVYKLPPDRLYVTYFSGEPSLGLEPDEECREIWLKLGLPESHVLPFDMVDNFWDMGETGPCGPCTEIHFDHVGGRDAASLVNKGNPEVVELWNLVFMQYERQPDSSLRPLPKHHVDTGMGLERLTAVLQEKISNYDTDLFVPLFNKLQKSCGCQAYQGRLPGEQGGDLDTAYRIVADHARMATVAIADGLLPGRKDVDSKLRHVIHRSLRYANKVLHAPAGTVSSLVPIIVDSLGEAFSEVATNPKLIMDVITTTEERYLQRIKNGEKVMKRVFNKYGAIKQLSGMQMLEIIEGGFGQPVVMDILEDLAEENGIALDHQGFQDLLSKQKEGAKTNQAIEEDHVTLTAHLIGSLQEAGTPATDDSFKYSYTPSEEPGSYRVPSINSTLQAVVYDGELHDTVPPGVTCGLILDQTCFYAEAGGQVADQGYITPITQEGSGVQFEVEDVQSYQNYVLHIGKLTGGTLKNGDHVQLHVNQDTREGCMCHHTATHVLQHALSQVLGSVSQAGSYVADKKLTFDFRSAKGLSQHELERVSELANSVIQNQLPVYSKEVPLSQATAIKGLVLLRDEVYPRTVRVVSMGVPVEDLLESTGSDQGASHSIELCGGTHVHNTCHLGQMVITQAQGVSQGTARITAVTGQLAKQAQQEGESLTSDLEGLKVLISEKKAKKDWPRLAEKIQQCLHDGRLLDKITRDHIEQELETLNKDHINKERNAQQRKNIKQILQEATTKCRPGQLTVLEVKAKKHKDVQNAIDTVNSKHAMLIFIDNPNKKQTSAIFYRPQDGNCDVSATEFLHELPCLDGDNITAAPVKGREKQDHLSSISVKTVKHKKQLIQAMTDTFQSKI